MSKTEKEIAALFAAARKAMENEDWMILPKTKKTAKQVRRLGRKK